MKAPALGCFLVVLAVLTLLGTGASEHVQFQDCVQPVPEGCFLTVDQVASGTFTEAPQAHTWWLVVPTSGAFEVVLTPGFSTARLYVYGPTGEDFGDAEERSGSLLIAMSGVRPGPYQVQVDSPGTETGSYSVLARRTDAPSSTSTGTQVSALPRCPAFWSFEAPAAGDRVQGQGYVSGWALDATGAALGALEVWDQGTLIATGATGVPRPDVDAELGLSNSYSGYSIPIDWSRLSPGSHFITVRGRLDQPARDQCGGDPSRSIGVIVTLPALSINDIQVSGLVGRAADAVFTVTLSSPSTSAVSVQYATADGSARAPTDYARTTGTLNFPPGTTSEQVRVQVFFGGGGVRTFYINLSNPTNATIADAQGVGSWRI